jgi:SAM-dependent methyltransferase
VLEVGCGTARSRASSRGLPGVSEVVGLDPSPVFIDRARQSVGEVENLSFVLGNGRSLPFPDASFDAIVFHTTLSHNPETDEVLREAHRVAAEGALLVVFDGDYATTTVALAATIPWKRVRRRPWTGSCTTLGSCAGFPRSSPPWGGTSCAYAATATRRPATRTTWSRSSSEAPTSLPAMERSAPTRRRRSRPRRDGGSRPAKFFGHIAYASLVAAHTGG